MELKHATLTLRPMLDHVPQDKSKDDLKFERLQKFGEANNIFVNKMQKYEPFYSSEVNESLVKICKSARSEAIGFQYQDSNDRRYWEEQEKNANEIVSEIQTCCSLIKSRVDSLSVLSS